MKMWSAIKQLFAHSLAVLLVCAIWPTCPLPCGAQESKPGVAPPPTGNTDSKDLGQQAKPPEELGIATFGGGCFWCVEAVFENMEGVTDVVSGYTGGSVPNPNYQMVKTGMTGHAEVCQITYDPSKVTYLQLLEVFLKTHDPTTKNKQGPDFGTQYRSSIFYHNDAQKEEAQELIKRLDESKAFRGKIVTTLEHYTAFFRAEEYHQDYYRKHPSEAYCMSYVRPKIAKFKKVIKEMESREKKAKKEE